MIFFQSFIVIKNMDRLTAMAWSQIEETKCQCQHINADKCNAELQRAPYLP